MPGRKSVAVSVKAELDIVEAPPTKKRRTSLRRPTAKDEPTEFTSAQSVAIKVEVDDIVVAGPSTTWRRQRSSPVKVETVDVLRAAKGKGKARAKAEPSSLTASSWSEATSKVEPSPTKSKTPRKRAAQSTSSTGIEPSPKRLLRERKT